MPNITRQYSFIFQLGSWMLTMVKLTGRDHTDSSNRADIGTQDWLSAKPIFLLYIKLPPQAHYKLYDNMYVVIFWRPEIYTHRTELLPELCSPIILQTSNSLWAHTPTCSHFPHVYLDVVTNYVLGRCHLEMKPWSLSKKSEKCFQITLDVYSTVEANSPFK